MAVCEREKRNLNWTPELLSDLGVWVLLGSVFQKDAKGTFSLKTSLCLNSAGIQLGTALVICASRYLESWTALWLGIVGPQVPPEEPRGLG